MVFALDDGKDVKYDLSCGMMIGKRGKPVQGLQSQLAGLQIGEVINSFEDDRYRAFLNFVRRQRSGYYYSNLGTFLTRVRDMSRFEQFFAAGITNFTSDFKYQLKDVPRDLIKMSQEYNFKLTNDCIVQIKNHRDIIRNILKMEFQTITTLNILNNVVGATRMDDYYYGNQCQSFNELITRYNYNYETLMHYVDNLMTYEGIDRLSDAFRELRDYARMMSGLSPRYEKYPKNFLTTHRIAARNFNRLKQKFSEDGYAKVRDENQDLKWTVDDFKFIYPKTTQDIKDEASMQQHCVASYIQRVIDGQCHIIFMRYKDDPGQALITLEVRDGRVTQSKGKFNRDPYQPEVEAIKKYNEYLQNKRPKAKKQIKKENEKNVA